MFFVGGFLSLYLDIPGDAQAHETQQSQVASTTMFAFGVIQDFFLPLLCLIDIVIIYVVVQVCL